ncbi:DNA methylase [Alcanivorax sp. HI0083]|uniref:site-specific DNA-methyltransferase n=2 Tax=Alcanivorax TaxID=59753 RepID=UPI0007BAD7A8|nr:MULTISPECIES: site-specific DNA-methyltransferase [unclassified Alcanivorax]KZY32104.1 DNA methylase [Alcanivorax sp. HI0044]KZZ25714.1 DNA methylase [Alcanivorax sp. HI0083]
MPQLSWYKREEDLTRAALTPYRLLQPVTGLSYGEPDSANMLIEGDNLDALKALLPYYAGQVKCIFIDPPYNTQSAFEHYDDNLEHSQWLSMMYPRLQLLRSLLSKDGTIWVTLDDNEAHYFKVIADEIFMRKNFVCNALWQKRTSADARIQMGAAHDHLFVYARDINKISLNRLALDRSKATGFKNPDNDPRGPWSSTDFTAQGWRPNQMYKIQLPSGRIVEPPAGRCWSNIEPVFHELRKQGRMWFGAKGDGRPRVKNYLAEHEGVSSWTWWPNSEVGHNQESKKEINELFGADQAFDTPKPERLIKRILDIATNPGDIVLDSFLGSGTTAAVAHKTGRQWIGIEMGEHARSHCQPRLKEVVLGEQGGISKSVNWQGGGGFRFFKLGAPVFDENGHIRPDIRFESLAAHVWFSETGIARSTRAPKESFLGSHNGIGYYLLYNGILGDESNGGGNVLTRRVLRSLPKFDGPKVIYGEASGLTQEQLDELDITFKQTPYDIKA